MVASVRRPGAPVAPPPDKLRLPEPQPGPAPLRPRSAQLGARPEDIALQNKLYAAELKAAREREAGSGWNGFKKWVGSTVPGLGKATGWKPD